MASPQQMVWLKSMVPGAQAAMVAFGVPASVTLAQCILESGWGQSALAKQCNNLFGIKSEGDGHEESFPTTEYEGGERVTVDAEFESYPDPEASFRDHARLLSTLPRYAPAMAVKSNPQHFCEQLQACGYSTSPSYATMLWSIINFYNLTNYDSPAVYE